MTQELVTRADGLPAVESGSEVTTLVQMAIENKVPVELLEKLVAMKERFEERDARQAFVEALAAFRNELPPIIRTRENTQFSVTRGGVKRYAKYAPLEDIDKAARLVAAKHGLVWTWNTDVDEHLMRVTCRVTHVGGHFEETTVSMPYESKAGSSPQQKYGSTQTYGMRYSLIAALGITTADEDIDGAGGDGGGDKEPITADQVAALSDLIESVEADKPKFLRYMGVESLENIPAENYKRAVDALEQKRKAAV
jgi:hypothetical protein